VLLRREGYVVSRRIINTCIMKRTALWAAAMAVRIIGRHDPEEKLEVLD